MHLLFIIIATTWAMLAYVYLVLLLYPCNVICAQFCMERTTLLTTVWVSVLQQLLSRCTVKFMSILQANVVSSLAELAHNRCIVCMCTQFNLNPKCNNSIHEKQLNSWVATVHMCKYFIVDIQRHFLCSIENCCHLCSLKQSQHPRTWIHTYTTNTCYWTMDQCMQMVPWTQIMNMQQKTVN